MQTLCSTETGRTSANDQNININLLAIGLGDLSLVGGHAGLGVSSVQGVKLKDVMSGSTTRRSFIGKAKVQPRGVDVEARKMFDYRNTTPPLTIMWSTDRQCSKAKGRP